MHHKGALVFAGLALVTASGWWVYAAPGSPGPSATIPYEGFLELDGVPLNSVDRDVVFSLYPDAVPQMPPVMPLWTETHTVSPVQGRFAVRLGSVSSIGSVLAAADELYLGVEIRDVGAGSGVTLSGRQLLGSVPYARRAPPGTAFVADGLVSGEVGVGTNAPEAALHVASGSSVLALNAPADVTSTSGATDTLQSGDLYAEGRVFADQVVARNVGGCYTRYGSHGCAPGYDEVVVGSLGGVENYHGTSGIERSHNVCINDDAQVNTTHSGYYNRLMRSGTTLNPTDRFAMTATHPACSVCCRGGSYTSYGSSDPAMDPQCSAGYTAAYVGRTGGVEAFNGVNHYGQTLCIDSDPATDRFQWGAVYSTRLMRYMQQPTTGGPNGMQWVDGSCTVCVAEW